MSSGKASILAIVSWCLTLNCTRPKFLKYFSASDTILSFSSVIDCPYGNLDDIQAYAGLFQLGRFSILETSRMSFFVMPVSFKGLLTLSSLEAFNPGRNSCDKKGHTRSLKN